MANILSRFAEIMSANVNDLLDKCENNEKMLDHSLRKARENLAEVKTSTKEVMADEILAKKNLDKLEAKAQTEHQYALNYIKKGDEETAARFLASEKTIRENEVEPAKKAWLAAKENARHMTEMYNKLTDDIAVMQDNLNTAKGTMRVAKAAEQISSMKNPKDCRADFERYQEKAERALAKAQAGIALDTQPVDELQALRESADASPVDDADAMEALKREAGLLSGDN